MSGFSMYNEVQKLSFIIPLRRLDGRYNSEAGKDL